MATKKAAILTVAISLLAVMGGLGLMFLLVDINSGGAEKKVAALGEIVGIGTLVPIGVVWLMWGLTNRKEYEGTIQYPTSKR